MTTDDPWRLHREALGQFLRSQRQMANLSLRELADLTKVSNPYLSQVERGMHTPSVRVLKSIAKALNLSADMVMAQAGFLDEDEVVEAGEGSGEGAEPPPPLTETAIRNDPKLTQQQKESLLAVYRSYLGDSR